MPMGAIQKQKFQTWLSSRGAAASAPCSLCGGSAWDVGELIDAQTMSGVAAPMVQWVCQTCGHVLLIDARKAGVM